MVYAVAPALIGLASVFTALSAWLHRRSGNAYMTIMACLFSVVGVAGLLVETFEGSGVTLYAAAHSSYFTATIVVFMAPLGFRPLLNGCAIAAFIALAIMTMLITGMPLPVFLTFLIAFWIIAAAHSLLTKADRAPYIVLLVSWLALAVATLFFGPSPGEPLPIPDHMEGLQGYQPPAPDPVFTPLNWHVFHTLTAAWIGLTGVSISMLARRELARTQPA